jgi:hypothetical protein
VQEFQVQAMPTCVCVGEEWEGGGQGGWGQEG